MGIYIEIALSLVLVFLVLSLVVTAINELIAMQLRKRPKMLLKTITALIDDPKVREKFYANGIVVSTKEASAGEAVAINDRNHPSYIDGTNFARALTMAVLKSTGNEGPLSQTFKLGDVESAVLSLPESFRIRDVLIAALSGAQDSIETFEKQVATWFDTTQDRLTGEYARHQRWITLLVGGLLVVFLNADSIRLTRELQANDSLRSEFVDKAEDLFASGIEDPCKKVPEDQYEACIVEETRGFLGLLEPALIGWQGDPALAAAQGLFASEAQAAEGDPMADASPNPLGLAVNKLLGLLITMMAISLGAPFWFDMLNKLVNIRGAGVKPGRTTDAA